MKRPSFQFYPSDWLRDTGLRVCSVAARGLWIDMICHMHEGNPYGYLKVNQKVILPANLAVIVGVSVEVVESLLDELEEAGVFSRDDDGCIFSRRMIRDENIRQKRAEGGKLGGNPALKDNQKVNLKDNQKVEKEVKQKPTPSSSSSSSSSVVNIPPNPLEGGTAGDEKTESFQLDADQTPQTASQQKAKRERKPAQEMPSIPEALNTPAFLSAWDDFTAHRKSIRKPLSPKAAELNLKKCLELGPDTACNAIEQSIANGWTGIFEPKASTSTAVNGSKPKRDPRVPAHIPDHQAQMWILHQETNCYAHIFGDLHANRDID